MSAVDRFARVSQLFRSLSLYKFYKKYPVIYLGFTAVFALIGYIYLLLFPAGAIFGTYQFYQTVLLPFDYQMLMNALAWISVAMFCAGITHGLITLKIKDPEGIPLSAEKTQLIFDKIREIEAPLKWPRIDNIILSRRFELNIIKTPRWFAPFWSKNTLVIGYPFMQTLSPENFECALTRKIVQYSKRKNIFINWLSYLRSTWMMYPDALKQRNKLGDQLSFAFFRAYAWAYREFALYATQKDELEGDSLALHSLNDRDLFTSVEAVRLVQKFLDKHYWPKLADALSRHPTAPEKIRPYEHLPRAALQMMNNSKVNDWLKMLMMETESEGSHEPSFTERMDAMGYQKICSIKPYNKTAAEHYFGPLNPRLVDHMNKLWAIHAKQQLENEKRKPRLKFMGAADPKLSVAF